MKATMWLGAMVIVAGCAVDEAETAQSEQRVSSTQVTRWNGVSADTMQFDPVSMTGLMLFAQQGGQMNMSSLWVDMQGWDANGLFYALRASGALPDGALVVGNHASRADLTVTVQPGAFWVERCNMDFGWFTCSPSSESFVVDMHWTASDWYSFSRTGTERVSMVGMTVRTHGNYEGGSANVSGTVAGVTFSNGPGMMNDSKGTEVRREFTVN